VAYTPDISSAPPWRALFGTLPAAFAGSCIATPLSAPIAILGSDAPLAGSLAFGSPFAIVTWIWASAISALLLSLLILPISLVVPATWRLRHRVLLLAVSGAIAGGGFLRWWNPPVAGPNWLVLIGAIYGFSTAIIWAQFFARPNEESSLG
jgi:hypothetical protein